MFGAIIVDPPGLAKVDHEYLLVQSELYLGPHGQPGSLRKMQNESWDAVVFNGYATQYKEGRYLLQPGPDQGGAGVLDLQPAQGGFVEFSFDEPGLYPIVTHKFANVAKGALGLFQAGDVHATGGGH
jgi:nitrite reductase (NO-forming)